jgi:predicted ATPase/class 3 adenylate cyclase/DNA-binding CsgD family transcriptional regulator
MPVGHDVTRARGPLLMAGVGTDPEHGFALPTGTVTFLLTDVEGSTKAWEATPQAMATAIARHYDLLAEAIAGHGGVRPVEQGEGDSVVGAFSRASDGIAAAIDAQRALGAEDWPEGGALRVRMALHTGEAQMRDSGNYFGQAIIRCARLRAIGHGGQVLVSDAAAGLLGGALSGDVELVDLGVHRLKDLGRPERVWQLCAPGLSRDFPPLRSLDAFRHNLPVQITPLIGREQLIADVLARLGEDRLVTLTGSGGVGKTRLALAVAGEGLDRFPAGVWLVELAGVAHPDGVAAAVLAALGVQPGPGVDLVDQAAALLGGARSLLVFDNCEHLVGGCAEFVAGLLAASSSVSVLATSREPLSAPGEVTWRVPSLAAPPAEPLLAVASLSQYDAVRLFIDRARRARPSFVVSETNAPAVAQICYRLDGIPLAIELAAARCRQLSVERIAHDLDDRFRLLTGGARTLLPRHQTLGASIDWSYDRLDPAEAVTFRRLGVFAGPFPLDAAEAIVASLGDVNPVGVFEAVNRLVDKSLVVVDDTADGDPRYRLLETLRTYAANRADAAGDLAPLRRHHATWWLSWLQARWSVAHTDAVVDEVELFYGSLKAALDWSVAEPGIGLPFLRYLCRPLLGTGRASDLLDAVDHLLTQENTNEHAGEWVAAAYTVGPLLDMSRGVAAAWAIEDEAKRLADSIGDDYGLVILQLLRGMAQDVGPTLRAMARQRQDRYMEAFGTINSAWVLAFNDPRRAEALLNTEEFAQASRESTSLGDFADWDRALVALGLGDLPACLVLADKLMHSRSTFIVGSGVYLAASAGLLGADEARLELAGEVAQRRLLAESLGSLVRHHLDQLRGGRPADNPFLRPDADHMSSLEIHLAAREAIEAGYPELAIGAARERIGPEPYAQAVLALLEAKIQNSEDRCHEGLHIAAEHHLRLVVVDALEVLAVTASRSESWAECLRLYGAAQKLREECQYCWRFPSEQAAIDEAVSAARSQLAPDASDAAEAQGCELAWFEAVQYARRARGERKRPRHGWAALTPTELQVVDLVGQGLTNQQIAERLIMGRATVKTHLEHIFAKLGVTSRTDLALQAERRKN